MSYAENRIIHDADSHLMELADCLDPYLDAKSRARYDELPKLKAWPRDSDWVSKSRATQADPVFRAGETANILLRKDYEALGAFIREDRPRALDLLGFKSQLVFTTWCLSNFGLDESEEFIRQNRLIRDAWGPRAVPVCEELPGRNHFSALEALVEPGHRLHALALGMLQER